MKFKKGQVTIFIILAILIVLGVALFFVFRGSVSFSESSPVYGEVFTFTQDCLERTFEDAIYFNFINGGYSEKQQLSTEEGVPYYSFEKRIYTPSLDVLEDEFEKYISRKFFLCSLNYVDFKEYSIKTGNFEANVEIESEKVFLEVDYPVSIKKGEFVAEIKDFEMDFDVRIPLMYEAVEELVGSSQKGVCMSCLNDIYEEKGLVVNVNQSGNVKVFVIKDPRRFVDDKEVEWRFAMYNG